MAKLSSLKVDAKKVSKGVWCEYENGVRFLIARKPNPAYEEAMEEAIHPHLASIRAGVFDPELDKSITKEVASKTILLGWENLEDDNGDPIKYSPEKALEIFNDPECADIYRFVMTMASSSGRYRKKEIESAKKN